MPIEQQKSISVVTVRLQSNSIVPGVLGSHGLYPGTYLLPTMRL